MKITKIGHCCLIIKEQGLTILTDPGSYTIDGQSSVTGIDIVLITHEHGDHLHVDSLKTILKNNPNAKVITNSSVGTILDKEGIASIVVAHGEKYDVGGVSIEGYGKIHAEIYKTLPRVENTGYMINKRLFYPGDALYNPEQPVDILALPVAGPWLKISEVIDYALAVNPKQAFPVHDGGLNKFGNFVGTMLGRLLPDSKISFIAIELNKEIEL